VIPTIRTTELGDEASEGHTDHSDVAGVAHLAVVSHFTPGSVEKRPDWRALRASAGPGRPEKTGDWEKATRYTLSPMRACRLTLVISSLAAGGAERVMSLLASHWAQAGHTVTLITMASPADDHYPVDSRVRRIDLTPSWNGWRHLSAFHRNAKLCRLLRHSVLATEPDAVVSFIDKINMCVLTSMLATGIPVVISERTDPRCHRLGPGWSWLRRALYPLADVLVVQTPTVERWAADFLPAKKVQIIPNPVVVPTAPSAPPEKCGNSVIAVGRLSREKGFDLLLDGFARSRLPNAGWHLTILGDGPERAALQTQAATLGLTACTRFPGVVTDPFAWLRQADIFVLSSRFEGFPNVLLEAMACGLAVIAFDCESGPRAIVRHDCDGFLVSPEDVDELAGALDALAADEELRRRLGAAACRVVERYALPDVAAEWETLLGEVIERRRGRHAERTAHEG
jgi:GalNAc-alpha-(1->4)-GalNAc-alpha-(1->3)-diNAcBac-PP-undecaprenol alpha-1,4-N-acetyl-D-galactosaminyltransferase